MGEAAGRRAGARGERGGGATAAAAVGRQRSAAGGPQQPAYFPATPPSPPPACRGQAVPAGRGGQGGGAGGNAGGHSALSARCARPAGRVRALSRLLRLPGTLAAAAGPGAGVPGLAGGCCLRGAAGMLPGGGGGRCGALGQALAGAPAAPPCRVCAASPPSLVRPRAPPPPPPAALQDQARISGALYVLRFLARKYEFRDEDERAPLEGVVNATFPTLLQIFQVGARRCLQAPGRAACALLRRDSSQTVSHVPASAACLAWRLQVLSSTGRRTRVHLHRLSSVAGATGHSRAASPRLTPRLCHPCVASLSNCLYFRCLWVLPPPADAAGHGQPQPRAGGAAQAGVQDLLVRHLHVHPLHPQPRGTVCRLDGLLPRPHGQAAAAGEARQSCCRCCRPCCCFCCCCPAAASAAGTPAVAAAAAVAAAPARCSCRRCAAGLLPTDWG